MYDPTFPASMLMFIDVILFSALYGQIGLLAVAIVIGTLLIYLKAKTSG